jgi:hypothetical protein
MNELSEKEQALLKKLKVKCPDLKLLKLRLKISIGLCYFLWLMIPLIAFAAYLNEGPPKIYHILGLGSLFLVTLGLFINCRACLNVLKKEKNDE